MLHDMIICLAIWWVIVRTCEVIQAGRENRPPKREKESGLIDPRQALVFILALVGIVSIAVAFGAR